VNCPVVNRPIVVIMQHLRYDVGVNRIGWNRLRPGYRVTRGQVIGHVGNTGTTNTHLDMEFTNVPYRNRWDGATRPHPRWYTNRINGLFFYYRRMNFIDVSQSSLHCRFWDIEHRYRVSADGRTTCTGGHFICIARLATFNGRSDRMHYPANS